MVVLITSRRHGVMGLLYLIAVLSLWCLQKTVDCTNSLLCMMVHGSCSYGLWFLVSGFWFLVSLDRPTVQLGTCFSVVIFLGLLRERALSFLFRETSCYLCTY